MSLHTPVAHSANHRIYLYRFVRNLVFGSLIIFLSLFLGMLGYRYLENLTWLDAFLNAAMILAGMGPVDTLHSSAGKLFAGCYALFSGVIFLVVIGVTFAPVIHWCLVRFHMQNK
jgi:small-conductance mechanosensitive channel